jgi:hypothetical protein
MSANTEEFKALEIKMAAADVQISADLQDVNTRLEKLLESEPESEDDIQIITQKKGAEEQQKQSFCNVSRCARQQQMEQRRQQVIPLEITNFLEKLEQFMVMSDR